MPPAANKNRPSELRNPRPPKPHSPSAPKARYTRNDCKHLCSRHQRMANEGTNECLQKSLEVLPVDDQHAINTVWQLFSSSKPASRALMLKGLVTICCTDQLSLLSESVPRACRNDPFVALPREVSIKILSYVDPISLGAAAQVNRSWRALANDDLLWRTMCEQHIDRKCEKCGWGLALFERRKARKQKPAAGASSPNSPRPKPQLRSDSHSSLRVRVTPKGDTVLDGSRALLKGEGFEPPSAASSRAASPSPLDSNTRIPPLPKHGLSKAWKKMYTESLALERNWRSGKCAVSVLEGHKDAVTCLQMDDKLGALMTGSWDRTVRVWDMETGQASHVLRGHTRGVRCLKFDKSKLITGSMDSTVKIWDWNREVCVRTIEGAVGGVLSLTFDDELLVSGSADSSVRVTNFDSGEGFMLRGHREWVNAVELWKAPNTSTSSSASLASSDYASGSTLTATSSTSTKPKLLFSASDDGEIRVWDLAKRACVRVLQGHVAQVQSLKILNVSAEELAQFRMAATPARPGFTADATTAGQPAEESFDPGLDVVSPDGSRPMVLSGSLDNCVKLFDVALGKCTRTMFGHIQGVWDVDADALRLVSGSSDGTTKIWCRESGRCEHTLVGHCGAVTAVAVGDDKIATGGDDYTVRIWSFAPSTEAVEALATDVGIAEDDAAVDSE